jgi:sodium transport system permease protein
MRTNIITAIYRKEIKEVLRDKRMLYLVILMPFFLYPILFTLMGQVTSSQRDKLENEKVTVVINPEAQDGPVYQLLSQDTTLRLRTGPVTAAAIDTLKKGIGIQVPENFQALLDSNAVAAITIYGDNTQEVVSQRRRRIAGMLDGIGQQVVVQRLAARGMDAELLQPIRIQQQDLASNEAQTGKALGSFLPAMILFFIFLGSIYIAIDITAGEKERRTLQTLFSTPATTREIISGKFLAVASVGIISGAANLLSLMLSMLILVKYMGGGLDGMTLDVSPEGWVFLVVLVLLSTLFIGSISLAVVLLANSYKEAQSYVTPLMMVVLIPAFLSQMPGMELTAQTAMIPMLNICLAIGEIFQGSASLGLIGLVAGFALLYGFFGLWLASKTFGNENVVNGEKVDFKSLFGR